MCFQQIARIKIPAKKGAKDYSAISKFPDEMARLAGERKLQPRLVVRRTAARASESSRH